MKNYLYVTNSCQTWTHAHIYRIRSSKWIDKIDNWSTQMQTNNLPSLKFCVEEVSHLLLVIYFYLLPSFKFHINITKQKEFFPPFPYRIIQETRNVIHRGSNYSQNSKEKHISRMIKPWCWRTEKLFKNQPKMKLYQSLKPHSKMRKRN